MFGGAGTDFGGGGASGVVFRRVDVPG